MLFYVTVAQHNPRRPSRTAGKRAVLQLTRAARAVVSVPRPYPRESEHSLDSSSISFSWRDAWLS